ncbi:dipeptidase 1-like [Mizuhopecten yessoensis]|uniref:Dipeptidase n=1 Tax=Mizuhopecten yessoensis TaxID=6573 RepID=A0A210QIG2_MIZYE|nr:dipeptidase 1-like [Mizuhopecten yessoensis]XP_021357345.1 dipeptidase 1-like [Mizuhopecten yessoensis]OWF48578.1 Dipeptidase 1 [Mizuhopecten yessoensis]
MSTGGSTHGLTSSELAFKKGSNRDKLVLGLVIVGGLALVIGLAVGIPLSRRAAPAVPIHDPDLAFAKTFLQTNVLIDGHNDLPWQYRQYAKNKAYSVMLNEDTRTQWPAGTPMTDSAFPVLPPQTDIPRLRAGEVGAQWWAAFVSCAATFKDAVRQGFDQVDVIHKFTAKYPETFQLALSASDIETTFANDKIASLIGLEGGHMIGNSLGNLRMYYMIGVRYMTLTHSCDTDWADNYKADINGGISKGLTDFGRIVVREMNRLGMIIDLSHVSYQTMLDAMQASVAPVIFSHSSAFALCNHYRNVQDDVLLKLKQNKGVIMINFYTGFINCDADHANTTTVAQVADHIDYVKNLIGVDYVAIGADYDGVPFMPLELEDVSTYPVIFAELHRRKWSIEDLQKLAGLNFLRVFRAVEQVRDNKSNDNPHEDIINPADYITLHNCTTSF